MPIRTLHYPDGNSALGLDSKRWRGGAHPKARCETRNGEVHGKGSHLSPVDEKTEEKKNRETAERHTCCVISNATRYPHVDGEGGDERGQRVWEWTKERGLLSMRHHVFSMLDMALNPRMSDSPHDRIISGKPLNVPITSWIACGV